MLKGWSPNAQENNLFVLTDLIKITNVAYSIIIDDSEARTITWKYDDSTQDIVQIKQLGDPIVPPKEPSKVGYQFTHYEYTNGTKVKSTDKVTDDATITAKYTKIVTITWEYDDDFSETEEKAYLLGEPLVPPRELSKAGWHFTHYEYTDGTMFKSTDKVTGDATITAKYIKEVTITWNYNDGNNNEINVKFKEYDLAIKIPNVGDVIETLKVYRYTTITDLGTASKYNLFDINEDHHITATIIDKTGPIIIDLEDSETPYKYEQIVIVSAKVKVRISIWTYFPTGGSSDYTQAILPIHLEFGILCSSFAEGGHPDLIAHETIDGGVYKFDKWSPESLPPIGSSGQPFPFGSRVIGGPGSIFSFSATYTTI